MHREKKLLAGTEDYGKDLTGVQNLLKKHQRFEAELNGHDAKVKVGTWKCVYVVSTFVYMLCVSVLQAGRVIRIIGSLFVQVKLGLTRACLYA